jgi:hypothetical protein
VGPLERTARVDQIRGLLAEHGFVIARDISRLRQALRANTSETIEWLKFTLEGVGERTHGYAFEDTAF